MKHTHIALDPIRDATLWNAIDAHLQRIRQMPGNEARPFRELQVEAVVSAASASEAGQRISEVVVHADVGSLCHGEHDETTCETIDGDRIPVTTAQRLCCEALIQAVLVRPDGTVDRICAEQRTANRQQRRMLAAMYRTCAHPHCEVPFSACRIHHVEWFSNGGRTVVGNLLPLCEQHHHLVHEGRWNLTIDDERRVTWFRPDGTMWWRDDGPDRTRPPGRGVATSRMRSRTSQPCEQVRAGDEPANAPPASTTDRQPTLL